MGISPFLDEISFWNFFDTFLGHLFTSVYFAWLNLTLLSFCVLVFTLKPLILLPFGCPRVSFWDLLVLFIQSPWLWKKVITCPPPRLKKCAKLRFQHICILVTYFLKLTTISWWENLLLWNKLYLRFILSLPLLNKCAKFFFLFIRIANTALQLYSLISQLGNFELWNKLLVEMPHTKMKVIASMMPK